MTDFVRVKDSATGHEYSLPGQLVTDGVTIIDKPAVGSNGEPLPPKHYLDLAATNGRPEEPTPEPEPTYEPGTPEAEEANQ